MKLKRKFAAALLAVATIVAVCPAGVANATEVNSYTYNYDYWGLEYESPDAYQPLSYTDGKALGITPFKQPQGMFVRDTSIYVVDTGNNRIVEIAVDGDTMTVVREITEFTGDSEVLTFLSPQQLHKVLSHTDSA